MISFGSVLRAIGSPPSGATHWVPVFFSKLMKTFLSLKSFFSFLVIFFFLACGSGGTETGNSTDGEEGDDGTSGGGVRVVGELSSLTVSSLVLNQESTEGTVTDVVAVSPETGGSACDTQDIGDNGTFEIEIEEGQPWFLYFIDRSTNEFLGQYYSEDLDLDTLVPLVAEGEIDLGTLTIDGDTGLASSSLSIGNILADLGITEMVAEAIGNLDDIAGRYQNPDLDGDGTLDCEGEQSFILDFHVRYNMLLSGTQATIDDIIDDFLDQDDTTFEYVNTGIYVAYPTSYSSEDTGSVTFVDSDVTTDEGGAIPANTATSDVTTNNFGDYNGFGPNTSSTSELPTGTIIYSFGDKTLTFSGLRAPSLAEISASEGRIFPFITFTKTDSSCTTDCTLSNVGYQWLKKTEEGWTEASTDELDLLIAGDGGNISIRVDDDENRGIGITIPKTSVSGEIEWNSSNANLSGVTDDEFEAVTTDQICHLGLSYDDQLGMRYFQGINDAPGTCL